MEDATLNILMNGLLEGLIWDGAVKGVLGFP